VCWCVRDSSLPFSLTARGESVGKLLGSAPPASCRAAVSRCLAPAIPQEPPHVRTQAPRAGRSARRTGNRLPDRWPSRRRETTRAKELEISASALRLTPDEWQIALFGDQNPPDKRDLVEGKLVQLGMRAAELGTNVVFDFGFWGKDERSALRWIAGAVGARSQVVYLPIDQGEQRRRVTNRFATTSDQTFRMSDVELEQWRAQFQAPDDEELRGSQIPPVPPEHATWSEWASQRWPSLPDQYATTAANSR
jgi:predicted kinase